MTIDTNTIFISNRFRQIELNIINMAWELFSTNTLFDDIYIDNFMDNSGINENLSIYQYDVNNHYIEMLNPTIDITLITNVWVSTFTNPAASYCFIKLILPSNNYDLQSYISVDNGQNFYEYSNLYEYLSFTSIINNLDIVYLRGDVVDIPQTDDNRIIFKITTSNLNNVYIDAISCGLSY